MADFLNFKDPKVKLILITIGVAVLLYLLTGSWVNNIRSTEKTVDTNFTQLKQYCDRRLELIPQFVQLIQNVSPQAQDVAAQLSQIYVLGAKNPVNEQVLTDEKLMQVFISTQMSISSSLLLMVQQAENYPSLAQNRHFLMLKMELASLEQQIAYMTPLLNQSILIHNSLLSGFPKNWLNKIFLGQKEKLLVQVSTMNEQGLPAK